MWHGCSLELFHFTVASVLYDIILVMVVRALKPKPSFKRCVRVGVCWRPLCCGRAAHA